LLLATLKDVYAANPNLQSPAYFNWQFRDTPFRESDAYQFWILWESGEIRGFLGYMPVEFRFRGDVHRGCWTLNWHAFGHSANGLMLLSRLMQDYDHRFLIGLTSDSIDIYRAYRIPLMMNLPRWIGILNPEKVAQHFKIVNPVNRQRLRAASDRLLNNDDANGIVPCTRFDPDEEFDWSPWPNVRGHVRRTGTYLNWRYLDIPKHNYRAIHGDDGQFAIYRIERIEGTTDAVIRILEWRFSGRCAAEALACILKEGAAQEAVLADFFATARDVGAELEALGFVSSSVFGAEPIPFLFRPIHHTDGICVGIDMPPHRRRRDVDFDAWYITKGDSDLDRIKM